MLNESKIIYVTRIDSDDMLHKDVIAEVKKYPYQERRLLTYFKGYILFHKAPPLWKRIKWKITSKLFKNYDNSDSQRTN